MCGLADHGFFVELDGLLVEGLVRGDTVDTGFEFDPSRYCVVLGSGREVRVGQRVKVTLANVNLERKHIDLTCTGLQADAGAMEDVEVREVPLNEPFGVQRRGKGAGGGFGLPKRNSAGGKGGYLGRDLGPKKPYDQRGPAESRSFGAKKPWEKSDAGAGPRGGVGKKPWEKRTDEAPASDAEGGKKPWEKGEAPAGVGRTFTAKKPYEKRSDSAPADDTEGGKKPWEKREAPAGVGRTFTAKKPYEKHGDSAPADDTEGAKKPWEKREGDAPAGGRSFGGKKPWEKRDGDAPRWPLVRRQEALGEARG